MSHDLPTEAQVRAAMTRLLHDATSGTVSATASALAVRIGISRPALYRHYRPLVDELLATARQRHQLPVRPPARTLARDLEQELARAKQANEELRRHVTLYEEIIRQLTVDNARLHDQLEQQVGVVPLDARRHDRSS
jgi:AcrR family transcriptional regulator